MKYKNYTIEHRTRTNNTHYCEIYEPPYIYFTYTANHQTQQHAENVAKRLIDQHLTTKVNNAAHELANAEHDVREANIELKKAQDRYRKIVALL